MSKAPNPYFLIVNDERVCGPYKTVSAAKKAATKGFEPDCYFCIAQIIEDTPLSREIKWVKNG